MALHVPFTSANVVRCLVGEGIMHGCQFVFSIWEQADLCLRQWDSLCKWPKVILWLSAGGLVESSNSFACILVYFAFTHKRV